MVAKCLEASAHHAHLRCKSLCDKELLPQSAAGQEFCKDQPAIGKGEVQA